MREKSLLRNFTCVTFSLDDSWCAHKFADYKVVLLTNDNANKEKASLAGLLTFTMRQYVESLSDYPELVDKLSQAEEGNTKVYMYTHRAEYLQSFLFQRDGDSEKVFPEYLSSARLHAGIKSGKLVQVRERKIPK